MRFPRLISKLYFEPLLLSDQARIGLEQSLESYLSGQFQTPVKAESDDDVPYRVSRVYERYGSVGVIQVSGILDKHISMTDMVCYGGCDLMDIEQALKAAADDSRVETIVMAYDSPGGGLTGVPELAAAIRQVRAGGKEVVAYTDSQCCSAAYWLASQADEVIASESAIVGSIGVYIAILDQSRAMEMEGLRVELIKAGKYKAAGAPFKPLADEEKALFQARVDDIYSKFTKAVREGRGKIDSDTMQGQVFSIEAAQANGLIDGVVNSLDELVVSLM